MEERKKGRDGKGRREDEQGWKEGREDKGKEGRTRKKGRKVRGEEELGGGRTKGKENEQEWKEGGNGKED